MNDFSEVVHGQSCLRRAYNGDIGKRFKELLNDIHPGMAEEFEKLADGWWRYFETESYIACVSEHLDDEDKFGRLSMWRAYSESTGVAIVLNNTPFLSPSDALKAYTSPVEYLAEDEFEHKFNEIILNIENNIQFLKEIPKDYIINFAFEMLRFSIYSTKHPGFKEEREWRVIYSPFLGASDKLVKSVEVINGVPQPVYKIPLKDYPDEGFVGAEIPQLIDRIIIGPTEFPDALREAFTMLLGDAGVESPESRVFVSNIPLR
ncbi:DUF2971 domain-containing protein [Thalassospiraceae bacterium LMO-SO8]|nr:DUF2971 domain-containing protein [Alphaproteobacteria bacterium LMO-S08]WND76981.1 DUF2971 domain-containing protein [Thalassospiraceae bacterium LMO-SO8]